MKRKAAAVFAATLLAACDALVGLHAGQTTGGLGAGASGGIGGAQASISASTSSGAGGGPSCEDGVKDEGETDVDCGGPCLGCAYGERCNTDSDCLGSCSKGICVPSEPKVDWSRDMPAASPPSLSESSIAEDATGHLIMFGGLQGLNEVGDTYRYDGATWQNLSVQGPPPRRGGAIAYDSDRKITVLFGGSSGGSGAQGTTFLGDTWEWDGAAWSLRPAAGPKARRLSRLAYDPVLKVMMMFGGRDAAQDYADTWLYDGSSWKSGTPLPAPPPRDSHGMGWDPMSERVILFGGESGGANLDDTWSWNGVAWAKEATPSALTQRDDLHAAVDEARGRLVMFGGADGSTYFDETWEWDGAAWTLATPLDTPGAIKPSGAAWSSALKSLVMFSASGSSGGPETWRYYPLGVACEASSDCGSDACVDHLCCEHACPACNICNRIDKPGVCSIEMSPCDAGAD